MLDYNALAFDYARHRTVHPGVHKELLNCLHHSSMSRVLEVGCGTGNYIWSLAKCVRCNCWGIDSSTEMLDQASQHGDSVSFKIGRGEDLRFDSDFFDLIFTVDVIHHISHCSDYFCSALRVLKPGGLLCTVTDSEWIIRNRSPLSKYFPETVEVELRRYPSIDVLREEMGRAGFSFSGAEMVEFQYTLTDCAPYRAKAYSALHLIAPEAFERGLAQLENDTQSKPVPCTSRYIMLWCIKPSQPMMA